MNFEYHQVGTGYPRPSGLACKSLIFAHRNQNVTYSLSSLTMANINSTTISACPVSPPCRPEPA